MAATPMSWKWLTSCAVQAGRRLGMTATVKPFALSALPSAGELGCGQVASRLGGVQAGCLPGQDCASARLAPAVVAERAGRPDHPVAGHDEA